MHVSLFNLVSIVITITGIFSYINYRFLKFPAGIGLMAISIVFSLILVSLGYIGFEVKSKALFLLDQVDFSRSLIYGMLSFLLFAGSLHIDIGELKKQKGIVIVLATIGTLISTLVIGSLTYFAFLMFRLPMPLIYCFLFGALISPTDPIAVLAMLKKSKASKQLQVKIAGESLFNDGVGIVLFVTILQFISGDSIAPLHIFLLFVRETLGGFILGWLLGKIASFYLKKVDEYFVQVLITLSVVTAGYALASALKTSGPIAMVVAGIFVGNHGRLKAENKERRKYLDIFWELIDELLNAVLFVLIGVEVLGIHFSLNRLYVGLAAVAICLFARWVSVWIPIRIFSFFRPFVDKAVRMLTWGGLRGGLSVAMALSLPRTPYRDIILTTTYLVMAFSILVQGLTIQKYMLSRK